MNNDKILVIASWGSPAFWYEVEYSNPEENFKVKSCTSLKYIIESVRNISKIYVLVLDSIIDFDPKRNIKSNESFLEAFNECNINLTNIDNYEYILKKAEDLVKRFILKLEINNKSSIIILPAIGSPGGKIIFRGSPKNFLSLALIDIGKELIENFSRYNKILLDLTHGINFMPSLTLELGRLLANVLLLLSDLKEISIIAKNADPKVGDIQTLHVNTVYEEKIASLYIPPSTKNSLIETNRKLERDIENTIKNVNLKFKKIVIPIVSSLLHPLPLALIYLCYNSDYREILKILEDVKNIWLKSNILKRENEKIIIERNHIEIEPINVYLTLLAAAICKIIKKEKMINCIEDIEKLCETVYKKVSKMHEIIIKNEISNIKIRAKDLNENCIPLIELYQSNQKNNQKMKKSVNINDRIMIAHAGLQSDLVIVCKRSNKILLYYRDITSDKNKILELNNNFEKIRKILENGNLLIHFS